MRYVPELSVEEIAWCLKWIPTKFLKKLFYDKCVVCPAIRNQMQRTFEHFKWERELRRSTVDRDAGTAHNAGSTPAEALTIDQLSKDEKRHLFSTALGIPYEYMFIK